MKLEVVALSLILFSVITIILGIIKIHTYPGKIAEARGHPQKDAIEVTSLLGLIIFPFWMVALIWAYSGAVVGKLYSTEPVKPEDEKAGALPAGPAQTAEIGVATAELYPRFGLSGMIGLQSRSLSNLLDSSSINYGLGLPEQWNVFSGGRVRDNIEIQNERAQQLLLQYENKVLKAVEEVENAIIALNLGKSRLQHLQDATAATEQAVDLVQVQYDTGLTDFNNVLVTQRDLVYQQDQVVAAQAQIVTDLISLYKALGGGWNLDQAAELSGLPE